MQNRSHEPDRHQQKIASLYQKLVANKSAAETIRATYQTILNILEKVLNNNLHINYVQY